MDVCKLFSATWLIENGCMLTLAMMQGVLDTQNNPNHQVELTHNNNDKWVQVIWSMWLIHNVAYTSSWMEAIKLHYLHSSQTPSTLPDPKIWDVVARERHSFE